MYWFKYNRETKKIEFTCKEAEREYRAFKAKQPKVSLAEFLENPNIFKEIYTKSNVPNKYLMKVEDYIR